jgi:hypothetical protein
MDVILDLPDDHRSFDLAASDGLYVKTAGGTYGRALY